MPDRLEQSEMTINLRRTGANGVSRLVWQLYSTCGLGMRLLAVSRTWICPFDRLLQYVPRRGRLIEIGCGTGIFANLVSLEMSELSVVGHDLNPTVIAAAARTIGNRTNLKFELRTAQEAVATEHADVVVAIDLFHHLSAKEQLAVVQSIHKLLATGGLFLLKDLGVVPRWKYYANYLHDFLRNPRDRFHFRSRDNFVAMLRTAGFSVEVVPMPKAYLAHLLFVCRKD